jgi:hypothetical protein
MTRTTRGLFALVTLLICFASRPVEAQTAPQQLLGKSIILRWTVNVVNKGEDGQIHSGPIHYERLAYVSEAGRVFVRDVANTGQATRLRETSPGMNQSRAGYLHEAQFVGTSLVIIVSYVQGASRQTVSFNANYRACTASFVFAKEGGKPFRWLSMPDLQPRELLSSTVSGSTCSITDGNVLGGQ